MCSGQCTCLPGQWSEFTTPQWQGHFPKKNDSGIDIASYNWVPNNFKNVWRIVGEG